MNEAETLNEVVEDIRKAVHDIGVVAGNGRRIAPILGQYFDSIELGSERIRKSLNRLQRIIRALTETNCDGVDISAFSEPLTKVNDLGAGGCSTSLDAPEEKCAPQDSNEA